MKKLFAILLTLLMVLSLPLAVAADEVVTSHDAVTDASADLTVGTGENGAEVLAPSEETEPDETEPDNETEEAAKMQFGFHPESMKETLPAMGMGMLGIFLVTSVIILSVLILSKLGKKDEE